MWTNWSWCLIERSLKYCNKWFESKKTERKKSIHHRAVFWYFNCAKVENDLPYLNQISHIRWPTICAYLNAYRHCLTLLHSHSVCVCVRQIIKTMHSKINEIHFRFEIVRVVAFSPIINKLKRYMVLKSSHIEQKILCMNRRHVDSLNALHEYRYE